jgi:hypothetical protein
MACSKYEYVKKFEEKVVALPQTYIVVRIDVLTASFRAEGSPSSAVCTISRSPTTSAPSGS